MWISNLNTTTLLALTSWIQLFIPVHVHGDGMASRIFCEPVFIPAMIWRLRSMGYVDWSWGTFVSGDLSHS